MAKNSRKTKPKARKSRKKAVTATEQDRAKRSEALLERADLCRLSGRIAEALKHLRLLLKLEGGHAQEALVGTALCHELLGDSKKAVAFFRNARELAPLPVEDSLSVAHLHFELCDFSAAAEWLKDALSSNPKNEDIHRALRSVLERQSIFESRKEELRQQIKVDGRDRAFAEFIAVHADPQLYIERNQDVANAGLGGFQHWLTYGLYEGRILPGIEIHKGGQDLHTGLPWRRFTFQGKKIMARTAAVTAHATYETVLRNWRAQKRTQSAAIRNFLHSAPSKPLISIVVPVYNTDPALLQAMIESVLAQRYPNWELCLADDHSPSKHVVPLLRAYQKKDKRIRTVFRKQNGGISAATDSAIRLATGTYIAFLDHDDLLDDCALLCVVKTLQDNPHAKIIYTDEDKIGMDGVRYDPHFKPDWNRELFYGQNYISHLTVINTSVVSQVGKLRPEYDGSQDYDFLLRCIELVEDCEIIHIPKVLYSWRAVPGSTALSPDAKTYAWDAGRRALADHLRRTHDPYAIVERGSFPFSYRPNWSMGPCPLVSIIIPTRDKLSLLKVAVDSILEITTDCRFEVLIVDNGSVEPATLEWLRKVQAEDSRVRVLRHDIPFNYSALNNFAVGYSAGEVLAFLNNDIEVLHAGWLKELASLAARKEIGCVGAKLLYPDRTIQHAGVIIGSNGVASHACLGAPEEAPGYFGRLHLRQEYGAVTGACTVIRRQVFEDAGGFNEKELPVAFNDIDLCLKVKERGYRNLWTPHATLIHHESASRGKDDSTEKRSRFLQEVRYMQRRWNTLHYSDPAYNINLSLHDADFSLGKADWLF